MKAILGKKIGMLQVWDDSLKAVPVTIIEAGPCFVTQVKTASKDGYNALQIGYLESKENSLNKASKEHQKNMYAKVKKYMRNLKEVRDFEEEKEVGDVITCDIFKPGDKISVRGKGLGKGFQSVIKRHNFHGGRASHGSHFHRRPGAIGACAYPSEVEKGKKMPGRMGGKNANISNLEVMEVSLKENTIMLKGSVPGRKGNILHLYQK